MNPCRWIFLTLIVFLIAQPALAAKKKTKKKAEAPAAVEAADKKASAESSDKTMEALNELNNDKSEKSEKSEKAEGEKPKGKADPKKGDAKDAKADANVPAFRYKYKLNTSLGTHVTSGPPGWGVNVGGQFGIPVWRGHPLYIGPSLDFSLFNPGYQVNALAGAWYELRVYGAPRLSLQLGMTAGVAIFSGLPGQDSMGFAFLLDGSINQDLGDLATIRGQLRPGVIGNYFAFLVSLGIQFRFT